MAVVSSGTLPLELFGKDHNYPEKHCCACGKTSRRNKLERARMSFRKKALAMKKGAQKKARTQLNSNQKNHE